MLAVSSRDSRKQSLYNWEDLQMAPSVMESGHSAAYLSMSAPKESLLSLWPCLSQAGSRRPSDLAESYHSYSPNKQPVASLEPGSAPEE